MTTCLLIRHGQSEANVAGILAGHLDSALTEEGNRQAEQVAAALAHAPVAAIVTSPLSRCRATAAPLARAHPDAGEPTVEDRLAEVHYGAWTGALLKDLATDDLWPIIQQAPSTVTFPASPDHRHESMAAMSERAWQAWQYWDERVTAEHGAEALWVLVSHGDVIKSLLARALGLELDSFQSIVVDPASVSIVVHHQDRTAVTGLNLREDALTRLARPAQSEPTNVAVVGGGNA